MSLPFLGLIRFGVDDDCPCATPASSVVVRAWKQHQGWNGFDSSGGTFAAYLTATPAGALFGGAGARTINRLTGASSGSYLDVNPGGSKTGSSTYDVGDFLLTNPDPPYDDITGTVTLSSPYTLSTIQADVDDILADAAAHPAGMADGTWNIARRAEVVSSTTGSFPESSGFLRRYLAHYRFPGDADHETWWDASSTVDGAIAVSDETDPFVDHYSADADRVEGTGGSIYKIVTGWKKGAWYYRERAFIPCTGYYSARQYVTVANGGGGETLISSTSKTYFYHAGGYVDVRSPHLSAGDEDAGSYGGAFDLFREVRVYLYIQRSDTPPGGTSYTESSTAGQSEGC